MHPVDVAAVVVRLLIGMWLFAAVRKVSVRAGVDLTGWTVVVPARNEAANLPRLLPTLPDGVAVVVVDDDSDDDTAAIARAHGATVVCPEPLPAGWTGKTWACHSGRAAVTTPSVCFVDADVSFAPDGFADVATLATHHGLVSVQPHHCPGAPVEHLAALFNIVAVAGTDLASPTGARAGVRGAFGPVLATSVEALDAVGGFASVRTEVVEDAALADRFRADRRPVTVRLGGDAVSFRMYPGGFRELVEGFTKNLVGGLARVRRTTAALVVLWTTLLVQSTVTLIRLPIDAEPVWALGLYCVVSLQVWWMARAVGRFGPLTALAHPLLLAVFLAVFVRSLAARATGGVVWRGRRIET